jgi:hypothetical protein
MQEAYTEIRENKMTIYMWGKGAWGPIDKETGLPIRVVGGCVAYDEVVGRVDGHNYIIHKFLKGEIR